MTVAQSCPTLLDPMDFSMEYGPWNSPGQNTGANQLTEDLNIYYVSSFSFYVAHEAEPHSAKMMIVARRNTGLP